MTPEATKAKELIEKYKEYAYVEWRGGVDELTNEQAAKECALIAVGEIIKYVEGWDIESQMEFNNDGGHVEFWEAVKKEINKI